MSTIMKSNILALALLALLALGCSSGGGSSSDDSAANAAEGSIYNGTYSGQWRYESNGKYMPLTLTIQSDTTEGPYSGTATTIEDGQAHTGTINGGVKGSLFFLYIYWQDDYGTTVLGGQIIGVSAPFTYSGPLDYDVGGKHYDSGNFTLNGPTGD